MGEPTISGVTWTTLYDASSGNLPTHASYGFTKTGTFDTESISGGYLRLTKSSAAAAYYTKTSSMPAVQSGKCLLVHIRARLESGHVYTTGFDFGVNGLAASQADYDRLLLNGSWASWADSLYTVKSFTTSLKNHGDKNLLSGLAAFDLMVIWRLTGTNSGQGTHEVWYREVGSYGQDSARGYAMLYKQISFTNQNTNTFKFGDFYDALGQDWSVALIRAGWSSGASLTSSNSVPIFAAIQDEPTIAVTHSAATVAPAGTVTASGTLGGNVVATLGGSPWTGSATTVVTGASVTVPITTSATTVSPGNTVTASGTIPAGVTATINGNTISGTPTTIVTGVNTPSPTPPSKPTTPTWNGTSFTIYSVSAGSDAISTYHLQRADNANGTWADDQSSVSYSSLGFGTSSSTHGWSINTAKWYRVYVKDADARQSIPSDAIFGGDTGNNTCAVTFNGHTNLANKLVTFTPSTPLIVGGVVFDRTPISVTLDASGDGTVTLPRTSVATAADGSSGAPFLIVQANGEVFYRVIPDSSSATFASLSSP